MAQLAWSGIVWLQTATEESVKKSFKRRGVVASRCDDDIDEAHIDKIQNEIESEALERGHAVPDFNKLKHIYGAVVLEYLGPWDPLRPASDRCLCPHN